MYTYMHSAVLRTEMNRITAEFAIYIYIYIYIYVSVVYVTVATFAMYTGQVLPAALKRPKLCLFYFRST